MKRGTDQRVKFTKLQNALGLRRWQAKGLLQAIWDFASENAVLGDVGRFSDSDIAIGIDYDGDPACLIEALVETGWLDRHPVHRLVIHDWHEHCEEWVKKRVKRSGETFASANGCQCPPTAAYHNHNHNHSHNHKEAANAAAPPSVDEKRSETLATPSGEALTGPRPPTPARHQTDTPRSRKPDELFDTIAEVTSSDPRLNGSQIGRACTVLRSADPPYTAADVRRLVEIIPVELPWHKGRPTIGVIMKYIGLTRARSPTDQAEAKRKAKLAAEAAQRKADREAAQKQPAKSLKERR